MSAVVRGAGGSSREAFDLQSDPPLAPSQETARMGLAGPNLTAFMAAGESDPPAIAEDGTLLPSASPFGSAASVADGTAPKKGLDYRLAHTVDDRLGAFRLIHTAYVRAGLGESHRSGMRVTPHQIEPTSQIFVGLLREEVVSTVSLIGDGLLGLPMESMFAGEVRELRDSGQRLAEVSCLADRRQDTRRFLATFRELTRLMAQFARYEGIGNLLVTVNPRHVRFYTHYLGFVPISRRIADCPHVKNRPAVALRLEFGRIDRERPACYDDYFGSWVERAELSPYRIGRREYHLLTQIAGRHDGDQANTTCLRQAVA